MIVVGSGLIVVVNFDSCRWLGEDLHDEGGPGTKRTNELRVPEVIIASKKSEIDAFTELETWLFGMSVDDFY
ncbi:hypothetical protein Micbo1qcDRAFT_164519 [Microdochium bolleyi]|uniref:Uncharacterized protein n=1 Tax=Microdochium bolleyi TaxID=196109 RepID=A0A136IYP4_9PEZI|nr:hypothetical protein Micbo1qcDRAFT_164519 [Microdochium bolleyi]